MIFSSITFIYYFMPLLLIIYFLISNKYKNIVLVIFSLLFYFLGEPKYILILLLSCFLNYYFGNKINKSNHKKRWFITAIIYNISQLFIFKYLDFFIKVINDIFHSNINYVYIILPIGISFYTFQALGYIIDIYKGNHKPAKSILEFITYISLFPQLIAGPIVRFKDIKNELVKKKISYDNIAHGIKRFIIGLSKKVLLANVLGIYIKELVEVDLLSSWLKPILYTLQIYFDFSGYSDMAIGLGLILGFKFLENFNYPLIANSITDFWHRWHISLSSWFKDYVYIPLGGNKVGRWENIRNIFIVWILTGLWHGASWNFVLWGLYFCVILVIEKMYIKKILDKTRIIKYIYTFLLIIISFLIFNTNDISLLIKELENMFLIVDIPIFTKLTWILFKNYAIFLFIALISATPLAKIIGQKFKNRLPIIYSIGEIFFIIILLTLCTAFLIDESFNPFLYFRF